MKKVFSVSSLRLGAVVILGLLSLAVPHQASADVAVNLDAGFLYGTAGTQMPVGSLLLLVASSSGTTFGGPTAGSYTSGGDVILGASSFNTNFGTGGTGNLGGETTNLFTLSSTNYPTNLIGHDVALYWFPSISFTQYGTGTKPAALTAFGAYNPQAITITANTSQNPDKGNVWTVPTDPNNNYRLLFITAMNGGTQNEAEGFARFAVAPAAAPEPSTYALLGCAAVGFLGWNVYRRHRLA